MNPTTAAAVLSPYPTMKLTTGGPVTRGGAGLNLTDSVPPPPFATRGGGINTNHPRNAANAQQTGAGR